MPGEKPGKSHASLPRLPQSAPGGDYNGRMALLGIISDTHGTLDAAVYDAFANVDAIVHAGDIGPRSLLWELEAIAPTIAVRGNNDWGDYGSAVDESATPEIGGVELFVSHFPEDAEEAARSGEYDLVVHGHTHVPREELVGTTKLLNPGSATRPRAGSDPSVMLVCLKDGVVGPVRLVSLLD